MQIITFALTINIMWMLKKSNKKMLIKYFHWVQCVPTSAIEDHD